MFASDLLYTSTLMQLLAFHLILSTNILQVQGRVDVGTKMCTKMVSNNGIILERINKSNC